MTAILTILGLWALAAVVLWAVIARGMNAADRRDDEYFFDP